MNVVFLLTAHAADDERVWYHQARSLRKQDCHVMVVAPRATHVSDPDIHLYDSENFSRTQLIRHLADRLVNLHPDVVIGDTPMAVRAAQIYRKHHNPGCRVLYDVTEWYPSKKNTRNLAGCRKLLKMLAMKAFCYWTSRSTDGFIFGEYDKSLPFRKHFPEKPFVFTTYYPDLQYIRPKEPRMIKQEIRLFFSGNLTAEKGFLRVIETTIRLAKQNPDMRIVLIVLSPDSFECPHTDNLTLNIFPYMPFEQFCETASQSDMFLDLRDDDDENTRCLPIKLFYYMAMGRPVIYSDLQAIRTGCPEIGQFGFLTDPDDIDSIVGKISEYLHDSALYLQHCEQARTLAVQKYNWEAIEADFVRFILQNEFH